MCCQCLLLGGGAAWGVVSAAGVLGQAAAHLATAGWAGALAVLVRPTWRHLRLWHGTTRLRWMMGAHTAWCALQGRGRGTAWGTRADVVGHVGVYL